MSTSAAQQGRNQNGEYNILDSIIAETRLSPDDEAYDIAKRGVSAFIEELLKPQNDGEPVKKAMVDRMIAEIDAKLSTQMDEILHHPDFSRRWSRPGAACNCWSTAPTSARTSRSRFSAFPSRTCWTISRTRPR